MRTPDGVAKIYAPHGARIAGINPDLAENDHVPRRRGRSCPDFVIAGVAVLVDVTANLDGFLASNRASDVTAFNVSVDRDTNPMAV
jgi:hypothetical protein